MKTQMREKEEVVVEEEDILDKELVDEVSGDMLKDMVVDVGTVGLTKRITV